MTPEEIEATRWDYSKDSFQFRTKDQIMSDISRGRGGRVMAKTLQTNNKDGMTVRQLVDRLLSFDPETPVLIHDASGGFVAIERIEANTKFDHSPCVVIRQW